MKREYERTGVRCETCREEIGAGRRALILEEGTIGKTGFLSGSPENASVFCSEEDLIAGLGVEASTSLPARGPAVDRGRGLPRWVCDHCGAELAYGATAVRFMDSAADGCGLALQKDEDSSHFCSLGCAASFVTAGSEKSLAEWWRDVQKRLDERERQKRLSRSSIAPAWPREYSSSRRTNCQSACDRSSCSSPA